LAWNGCLFVINPDPLVGIGFCLVLLEGTLGSGTVRYFGRNRTTPARLLNYFLPAGFAGAVFAVFFGFLVFLSFF